MRNFLPNSGKARFLLAFLVLLLLVGAYFLFPQKEPQTIDKEFARKLATEYKRQVEQLNLDTDGDGLKDWEEAVFRTDVKNLDTDGDGTPDGEETKIGRNPLKPGPDDELTVSEELEFTGPPINFSPDNLTHRLAEQFNINYVVPFLANPNASLDIEQIGNKIIENSLSQNTGAYQTYTLKDFSLIHDNSNEVVKKYGEALVAAVANHFASLTTSELVIFSQALQTENLGSLRDLDRYITAYGELARALKKIPVPSDFAYIHLDYLNAVAAQKIAVGKIRNAEADTVAAILGAQEYAKNASFLETTAAKFNQEVVRRGIL